MTFPSAGHYLLIIALACAAANIALTALAFVPNARRETLLSLSHRAALSTWVALAGASGVLVYLFWINDFAVEYVWGHSAKAQPWQFKVAAFYGGQAGSILMWSGVLATYTLLLAIWGRRNKIEIAPAAVAICCFVNAFFIGLILWQANPFGTIEGAIPKDGFGLNPLLQNYWMQIHPPTLYTGYVGCTIPFALAMAALLHRKFDNDWAKMVRRWTLVVWIILFVGIVLGGVWAYETLGWGGYWAWDPVENASLMPWLVLTAFLHSIMLQERRGLLKNWNITLVSLTFLLSIFGTFLTRSGIVSSVHSFAESDIGNYLLGFLAVVFVLTFGLIFYRRDEMSSNARIESNLSREGAISVSNWLWLACAFTVLFGTIWPTIKEGLTGTSAVVEKSFFNQTVAPLSLFILALAGIGPLFSWQSSTPLQAVRAIKKPLWFMAIGVLVFVAPLLYFLGNWHTGAATAFLLCVFVVGAMGQELWRSASSNTLWKNRRRTGGYIVHLGLAIFFVGITGSSVFKIETEPRDLKVGEAMPLGEYALRFDGFGLPPQLAKEKKSDVAARITVLKDGVPLREMTPNIDVYKAAGEDNKEAMAGQPEQTARRPAIYSNLGHDIYLALIGYDMTKKTATIKAYLNPLVAWIWIAVGFFIFGSMIALLPDAKKSAAKVPPKISNLQSLPEEYSRANGNGKNGNGIHAPNGVLNPRVDAEVEIEIAVARAKIKLKNAVRGWRCDCGRAMQDDDKFCGSCGAARLEARHAELAEEPRA